MATIAPQGPATGARLTSPRLAARRDRPTSRGRAERRVASLLARADIALDGARPWDIRVRDSRLHRRVLRHGITGFADAYVDGWWECGALDDMFARALRADLPRATRWTPDAVASYLRHTLFNQQSRGRSHANGRAHYDIGNDLFAAMLDQRMAYSCAYWSTGASTLHEAQEAKLDLVCRKLGLDRARRVLDIGCGWGSFVRFAAERYGAPCVGITVSPAQAEAARSRCAALPVEILVQDYRSVAGRFDRVVSIGMFEHVGQKNHRAYMRAIDRVLTPDGLVLLHFFAARSSFPNLADNEVNWFERRIFPGMLIPSLAQVGRAIDGLFVVEDMHNLGVDYHPTLMAWWRNFDRAWPTLRRDHDYDDRFYRMWKFYLQGAAGAFLARKYQVWQIVLSKRGVPGGYTSVR